MQLDHSSMKPRRKRRLAIVFGTLLLPVVTAGIVTVITRHGGSAVAMTSTKQGSEGSVTVSVVPVKRRDLANSLKVTADFRPFQEINLHAKIVGYLRQIKVDVGDRVKAGDIIAALEIPEIEEDLRRSMAAVERAKQEVLRSKAAYDDAHLSFSRISEVIKTQPNLVAQQEIDQARSRDETLKASWGAMRAALDEALSNQDRLRDTIGYSKIVAPFGGTITRRYADTGSLVGGSSGNQPVVQLSQLDPLRLVLPVPESALPTVHIGDPVDILVQSTNQTIKASIARMSRTVSTETRTMHVEVDVPNTDASLAPGMYAYVTLMLEGKKAVLSIPVEAALNRKNEVANILLLDRENRIEERRISVGLETSTELEVNSGLEEGDLVVLGGQGRYVPGQVVEPKLTTAEKLH